MVERVKWAISATCSERALYTVDYYGIGINITRLGVCAIGVLLVCLLASRFLFSSSSLSSLVLFHLQCFHSFCLVSLSALTLFSSTIHTGVQVRTWTLLTFLSIIIFSLSGKEKLVFIILIIVVSLSAVLVHPSFLNQTFNLFDASILCSFSYPSLSCCSSAAMYQQLLHQLPRALNGKAGPSKLIGCVKEPPSWMARLPCADPTASSRSTQWTWVLICWTSSPWSRIPARMLPNQINQGKLLLPLCRVMLSLSLLLPLGGKRLL